MTDQALDLAQVFTTSLPAGVRRLAIACSGGADSMALMHIAHQAACVPLHVISIDHGLRPAARNEVAHVATIAARLNLPFTPVHLNLAPQTTGQQAAARAARHQALATAAHAAGCDAVALAHTADDQAETVWMRLASGATLDGFGAMAACAPAPVWPDGAGLVWLRPLLDQRRADLRAYLRNRGATWVEDPSNADPRYARVRARRTLAALPDRVAQQLAHLGHVAAGYDALAWAAAGALADAAVQWGDPVTVDACAYAAAAPISRQRMLAALSVCISGRLIAPRRERVLALDARLCTGPVRATLAGCRIARRGDQITVMVEVGRQTTDAPKPPQARMRFLQRVTLCKSAL